MIWTEHVGLNEQGYELYMRTCTAELTSRTGKK